MKLILTNSSSTRRRQCLIGIVGSLIFLFLVQTQSTAQYTISYSDETGLQLPNNDVHSCQVVTDSIHAIRVVIEDDAADNATIELDFQSGMSYLDGSMTILDQSGGITITTISYSSGSHVEISLSPSDLNAGDEITIAYSRYADCGAISHQSNGGTFKDEVLVSGDAGIVVESNPALANYDLLVPAISLFNEGAITTTVGSTVTRDISIVNGGLGFLKEASFTIDDMTGTNTLSLTSVNGTTISPSGSGAVKTYDIDASIISQYGNGDDNLDNGEEIILTRTYEVLSCVCPSSYEVIWNCEGSCEQDITLPQETIIANTVPNLVVSMPNVDEDVCYDGSNSFQTGSAVIQTVEVENIGTGAAIDFKLTMSNYNPGSGRGRHYFSSEAWVVKNAAGAVINTMSNPTSLGTLYYWQADCSTTTETTDMSQEAIDLVIEAGETVYIEIPIYYSNLTCPNCPKGPSWHMFNGAFQYGDICENNTYVIPRESLFNRRHNFQRYDIEMPTDVHDDECFDIDINYNRVQSYVGQNNISGGSVTAIVDLNNTGLTYQGGSTVQYGNYSLSVVETGGTLRISIPTNLANNGQVVLPVCVDCDLIGGGTVAIDFWHEIEYSSSCSTPIIQECKTELFVVHCPSPCPEGGATPLNFDLERITIGLEDLNDNGIPDSNNTADPDDIEAHRAVNGDQVKGTWDIHVYPNIIGSNANVPFEYVYVKFDTYTLNQSCNPAESPRTSYFDAEPNALATITPADGSPVFTCTVNPTIGSDGYATYDLSNCKDNWEGGDKIILEAIFTVNAFVSKTGESLYVADNECYSSYIPNPGADDQHYCDFYNDYMNIYNIYHSPYMPATQQILGCDNEAEARLRQYINIQAWNVWFPYEYRNFAMFDEYIVEWPSYMVYRPGSGTFNGLSIPDGDVTQTGTQLIFKNLRQFYQPYGGTLVPPDEISNAGILKWSVDPTCDAQPVFTSRFTALTVGNGVNTPSSNWSSHVGCATNHSGTATFTYDAPIPTITGGGETQPTTNETCWEINLNNNSNSQDAENTWFYFDDLNNTLGSITVFEGSTAINPNSNGFFELGTNVNSSSTNYTICADIESCGAIDLELSMGFGCTNYPSSFSNSDCVDSIILEGDPQDSEVQVELVSYPLNPNAVCKEQVVVLGLTSAQAAFLDDAYVEVSLPSGVSFVGDIELEYPSGSGNWQTVSYTTSGGNYIINIEDHSGIGPDGLPGTLDDPDELNREVNLRFVVTYPNTGGGIGLSSFGQTPCGGDALNNGVTVSTADLDPVFGNRITNAIVCPGVTYEWRDTTITTPGTYEIIRSNDLGCSFSLILNLEHFEVVDADIQGDTLLNCEILDVSLNALPDNFSYSWSNGESSQSISVDEPDTYYVSVTDDNGCESIDSIIVTQDLLEPLVEVVHDTICIGEDATLSVTTEGTYVWPDGETGSSITVTPLENSSYVVTVTSENGCTGTGEATVTLMPLPDASIFKLRDIFCSPNTGYIRAVVSYADLWSNLNNSEYISGGAACGDKYLHVIGDTPVSRVGDKENNIITGGESYTYSFQYRLTGTGVSRARIVFYDSTNKAIESIFENLAPASNWTNFSMNVVAPANAVHVYIGIYGSVNETIDYDCVELQDSNGSILMEQSFEEETPFYWEGPNGFKGASRGIYITEPGIYTLTVTDPVTGCQASESIEVFDHTDDPDGSLSDDGPFTCNQSSVTINATTSVLNAEYEWNTGDTDADLIVDTAGIYSVTITDPYNGCTTALEIEVQENFEEPEAAASNDGPLTCLQPNVIVSATPTGLTYEWSNGEITENILVVEGGEYTVTVTDVNGCTSSSTTEVIENNNPPEISLENEEICIGENINITAAGGETFDWSTGESGATINVEPITTTDYIVTVTDINGCTNTATSTVTVNPLPNNGITKVRDINCVPVNGYIRADQAYPNVPAYLNQAEYIQGGAACGDQYLEIYGDSPHAVVAENVPGIITGGETYDLSVQYRKSGSGSVSIRINFYTDTWVYISNVTEYLPDAANWTSYTLSGVAPPNAANTHFGLVVREDTQVDYDCVEFSNSSTLLFENSFETTSPYEWHGPNGFAGSGRGIHVNVPGIYTLTLTDPNTGCQNTNQIEVFDLTEPPGGEIMSNGPLTCAQTEVVLTASSPVVDATFEWSTGETGPTISVSTIGTYEVTITNPDTGCKSIESIEVLENVEAPSPTASNNGPLTCNDQIVTITALPQGLSYEWPDGSTDQTFDVSLGGEYIVTVTDVNGCTGTASSIVDEDLDEPMADAGEDVTHCAGEQTQLQAIGGESYEWSSAANLSNPSSSNPIATTQVTTTYVVTVTSVNGCTATDEVTVTIEEPSFTVSSDATTCEGDCTGSISIDVEHEVIGDFNLTYIYQGSTVVLGPFTSSNVVIENLCAGDYSNFNVYSLINGCTADWAGPISITEETVEWEHVTHTDDVSDCSGVCDGAFTVDANFGMSGEFMISYTYDGVVEEFGPYSFAGDILFDDLCAGVYSDITITSTETGCSSAWPDDIEILVPFPTAEIVEIENDECQEEEGSTIISVTGGTSPYTISWSNADNSHTGSTVLTHQGNIELEGLIGGNTYCIEVVDSNGCEAP